MTITTSNKTLISISLSLVFSLGIASSNAQTPVPIQYNADWPAKVTNHTTEGHGQCELNDPQAAGCTFLITPATFGDRILIKDDRVLTPLDGSANRTVMPGDKVCIAPGYYSGTIINKVAGTEAQPITVTNCGGQAVFRDEVPITRSRHIKLSGNGHDGTLYGIKIMGTLEEEAEYIAMYGEGFQTKSQAALDISAKSRNIEIAWVEMSNPRSPRAANIHFVTKTLTNPDGSYIVQYDLENTNEVFVQTGTYIHHNFIHHSLEGEGLYVGKFGCDQDLFDAGLALEDTRIHDNIVTNNGADGIQVGCSRKDTYIYNNYIFDAGYNPFNNRGHIKGFQLGKGTSGHLYNNYVDHGASDCVWAVGGPSDDGSNVSLWIYNNVFKDCEQMIGVARDADDVVAAGQSMEVYNNTVISMRSAHYFVSGALYDDIILSSVNNLYVDSQVNLARFVQGSIPANFTESFAFISSDSSSIAFTDDMSDDYSLTAQSPVIDMGSSPLVITDRDIRGESRDNIYDVGAFEYVAGPFAQLQGTANGKLYFRYFPGAPNLQENRIDVLGLGHSTLQFSLKLESGTPPLSSILVSLKAGGQTKDIPISNYVSSLDSDWTTIAIPLSDFPFTAGKLGKGIYEFGFRTLSSVGSFSLGFDEVKFTGGADDFIWYGDDYSDSVDPSSIYTSQPTQLFFVGEAISGGQ